jgi:hypothetical protein
MGCFEEQSDLPASPVSTISRDSWQQTRHHCSGEHHPDYRLPYAEGRNHVPRTGGDYFDKRNILRTTRRLIKRLEALGHRVILEPTQSPFQSSD